MNAWLLAVRPKTLPAAVAPVAAGTTLGWQLANALRWDLAWLALAGCLCLQIATNLFNDAIDFRKGADTAKRLGPTRVTASGLLSPRQVTWMAVAFLCGAAACAFPLFLARGWPIIALGIPSLYFCYGYTGGPAPLAYRGLGELFVLLFFGWVAVVGSTFLQTGDFHWEAVLLGTQIGLLSTSLIAINNLRDMEEDRATGKKTLATRFGLTFGRTEVAFCLLAPYVLGIGWLFGKLLILSPNRWLLGFPYAEYYPLPGMLLAGWIIYGIVHTSPSRAYNKLLALAALHLLLFSGLVMYGISQGPYRFLE